ncbi:hypothetical protein QYF36_020138 [Acer negundo]|nr:hypothetical protein QYF36_020138 [Acer negundo]
MTIKGGGGSGCSKQACAVCKHQRRKCANNCVFAPYFPADQQQDFMNAHRFFGVGNIMRLLKEVPEDQRQDTVKSIIYESNLRALNPVLGSWGVTLQYQRLFQATVEELHQVREKLAIFRGKQQFQDLGIVKKNNNNALQVYDYQNSAVDHVKFNEGLMKPEQQYYFDNPMFFSQGIPIHQPGLFALDQNIIPVEPPLMFVSEGLVPNYLQLDPLPVSEGIPFQPTLLVSQAMPILKGNPDLMVVDDRKTNPRTKGAYYVDESLDRIAGDTTKPYSGSKGAYCVDESLDRIAGDTKTYSGSKRAYYHVDDKSILDRIAGETKPYPGSKRAYYHVDDKSSLDRIDIGDIKPYFGSKGEYYHVDKSLDHSIFLTNDHIKLSTESKGACELAKARLEKKIEGTKENKARSHGSSALHTKAEDYRAPFTPKTPLRFCRYNGSVCCNSTDDLQLQNQFQAMNVSDTSCGTLLRSIICSRCDQFSAELYRIESKKPRTSVPVLCNSTVSVNSMQSQRAAVDFCSKVWDECKNVSISNSPFALQGRGGADSWQSKSAFCDEFGGGSEDDGLMCFDGGQVSLNNSRTESLSPPSGICIEKIGNGAYINMVAHPDGSNRVFLSNLEGKIWLATVPEEVLGGGTLQLNESDPFLDLTDIVHVDTELGMLGIAFHPNFLHNGRFFVSLNCDKVKWPGCSGRCSCNSDVGCDPSKLGPDNGAQPCQYHSVIAEFTANGTTSQPSSVTRVSPQEVRRIFTMGLPFTSHHGGQILFGPEDGYLYFMMGDGGSIGDPYNFSQNKKSLLGKIMRLDVDKMPSAKEISDLGQWGNYSVPADNPFSEENELEPEIWALGFRNPWRCSFDAERPSYFLCADVGQEEFEEVDIVTKGGNYGWRVYEGPFLYNPPTFSGGNTSARSINPIFPVMGYNHSDVDKLQGSASITGGYFYRSMTDPCLYGRYIYTDLNAGAVWVGAEQPENSGNFTSTKVLFNCAGDSPIQCDTKPESPFPSLGYITSFGQDNQRDIYFLSSKGVYRIVRPSRCNYTCSKENVTAFPRPGSSPSPTPSHSAAASIWLQSIPLVKLLFLISSSLLLWSIY